MRIIALIYIFFLVTSFAVSQEESLSRGSIPEELLRPKRGEAPRYPIDTVIGELGQGSAGSEAYSLARSIAAGLVSGDFRHPNLAVINSVVREGYISTLETIRPSSYRLGGGREEPDGAISFMVRFIGRERGITGELYVRYVTKQTEREIKIETAAKFDEDIENNEAVVETVAVNTAALETEAGDTAAVIADEEGEPKVEIITTGSWTFDDLILEDARSREEEKRDEVQRFDFSPYERFF